MKRLTKRPRAITPREWLSLGILAETAAYGAGVDGNVAARNYYRDLAKLCDQHAAEASATPKLRVLPPVTVLTRHQSVDPDEDTERVFVPLE